VEAPSAVAGDEGDIDDFSTACRGAFVVAVATGPAAETAAPVTPMSAQQKSAAMRPLVQSATECIAHSVADDPRLGFTDEIMLKIKEMIWAICSLT
jgi:hypothetical protein